MDGSTHWESLPAETFEDLCAVLISRMNPNSRRIEGIGSEEGRDVQIASPRGPVVFQIKSFSGRVTPRRRKQIIMAIERASRHKPSEWILITPIDPTPAEIRWFSDISSEYPFRCEWRGRTWLEHALSLYPDISHYYLEHANTEINNILRGLSKESASLIRGIPEATERMKSLVQRLNKLDPHYSFGISTSADGTAGLTIWPKYVGAEFDSSIDVGSLRIPLQEREDVESRYPSTVTRRGASRATPSSPSKPFLPHTLTGLSDSIQARELSLPQVDSVDNIDAQLRIIDANGRACAQLPLRVMSSNRRPSSADVQLEDPSGAIVVRVKANLSDQYISISFDFKMPKYALPSAILPGLRFLEQYRPPNAVVALINEWQIAEPVPIKSSLHTRVDKVLRLIGALDEIQRNTSIYFPVPRQIDSNEMTEIYSVQKLLAGKSVKTDWENLILSSTVSGLSSLKEAMARGPGNIRIETELALHLAGRDIPLGYRQRQTFNAAIVEWPDVPVDASPDTPVEVRLLPGADRTATTVIVRDDEARKSSALSAR